MRIGLGLSASEAKVYLTLAKQGPLSAEAVSNYVKIEKQDVYRAVLRLQKLGFVKVRGIPAVFYPFPVWSILLGNNEMKYLHNLPIRFDLFSGELYGCEMLEIVKNVRKSYDCIISGGGFKVGMQCVAEVFIDAVGRGVRCRHIINEPCEKLDFKIDSELINSPFFRVGYFPHCLPTCLIIVDGQEVLVSVSINQLGKVGFFWSTDSSLVLQTQFYFKTLWRASVEYCNNHSSHSNQQKIKNNLQVDR